MSRGNQSYLFGEAAADHLGQGLLLGLRLTGQLGATVTEARDVVLHLLDLVLLPGVLAHLLLLLLGTGLAELVVVTGVVGQLLVGQVHHVRAHVVQEVLQWSTETTQARED